MILLLSKKTPSGYIDHLKERNYHYIVTGEDKVDMPGAIEILHNKFNVSRILTDTGRILGNHLIRLGIVSEISLLIHPLVVGEKCYPMFSDLKESTSLKLVRSQQFENGCNWVVYKI